MSVLFHEVENPITMSEQELIDFMVQEFEFRLKQYKRMCHQKTRRAGYSAQLYAHENNMNAYPCWFCGWWHVGNKMRK